MTELMKQYEAGDDIEYLDFLENENAQLKSLFKQLKAQLTWRPVTQKPEKDGWYFVLCSVACDVLESVALFKNGEWNDENVWKWLPIPPAPEVI